jgi:signal transduction histidine kinase
LFANAIKFSPLSGTIRVGVRRGNEGQLELSISDEGPGIPETFRETIFAPFEQVPDQTKIAQEGTGLGLAICKSIAEGHNAKIFVRAGERRGSVFCVELPAGQSASKMEHLIWASVNNPINQE